MSNDVLLITSGAYANDEITSDFGLLPTSFLPVGHKRLLELQINLIKAFDGQAYISLPDDYVLLTRDRDLLTKNNIIAYRTDHNLSLSQSILCFIEEIGSNVMKRLFILHGDTLFNSIQFDNNLLYYGSSDMFYKWGYLNEFDKENSTDEYERDVISGYFSFNDIELLVKELKKTNSFESALIGYNNSIKFKIIKSKGWLDFGHSNLYYRSKRKLNVTRSFNQTYIENNNIRKESANVEKIKREFQWYNGVPELIKPYLPQVWGYAESKNRASYFIEFIGAPTLQEKYVFGNLPEYIFIRILDRIFDFIKTAKSMHFKSNIDFVRRNLKQLYIKKTESRINDFILNKFIDTSKEVSINGEKFPSLFEFSSEILNILNYNIENTSDLENLTLMHGDLCFSNILFDSRSNNIKIIDPRGSLNKNLDDNIIVYGDYRYDLAKLGHSIIGNYDYIVSGFYEMNYDLKNLCFEFEIQTEKSILLEQYYYRQCMNLNVSKKFIKASITNLFLSMLPLHDDDENRQIALLLNAYQFYFN